MYITLQQLGEKPGLMELAQVTAQVGQPPADWRIIGKIIDGEDVAGEPPVAVEKAQQAIARINEVIADASALIDGYLRQRGYKLPFKANTAHFNHVGAQSGPLPLHQHLPAKKADNPIVRDYAIRSEVLQLVAEGKFHLALKTNSCRLRLSEITKRDRVFYR